LRSRGASAEKDVTPFKIHADYGDSKKEHYKMEGDGENRDNKRFKQRSKKRSENTEDIWDIITVKDVTEKRSNDWDKSRENSKEKKNWGEYSKENIKSNKNSPEDFEITKPYKEKLRDSNRPRGQKDNDEGDRYKNADKPYDKPLKENRAENNWDEEKPRNKKMNSNWDNDPKTTKKRVNDWNNDDNSWSKTTRQRWDESERTTRKRWNREEKRNVDTHRQSYVPRRPEYNRHVARERNDAGFQGRTPIPFVGKKGIYDDK
jgi:hypothetical protein